jgi:coenzyme F420-0:L-glutamate ligase/coenzyme F420-1:gamma-L-glutamate ligase
MDSDKIGFLKNRRSIREYTSREVSERILETILEAATWAPSAHNAQPWRFIVVKDSALKLKLAKTMANRWEKDLAKNGVSEKDLENLVKASVERFTKAPIVIVPCLTMAEMHHYPDKRRQKIEFLMGVQSVAAAIENMLLAVHAMGLGACWFCAPLFCPETVRKVLKIPPNFEPQVLITLGYPAYRPWPPPRKLLKEIVHLNGWSETK